MMKAELTAENSPACVRLDSVFRTDYRNRATDEDKGRVQILVILFRVIPVKLFGFSAIYSEEVGSGIIGSQWFSELFEDGTEAGFRYQQQSG